MVTHEVEGLPDSPMTTEEFLDVLQMLIDDSEIMWEDALVIVRERNASDGTLQG